MTLPDRLGNGGEEAVKLSTLIRKLVRRGTEGQGGCCDRFGVYTACSHRNSFGQPTILRLCTSPGAEPHESLISEAVRLHRLVCVSDNLVEQSAQALQTYLEIRWQSLCELSKDSCVAVVEDLCNRPLYYGHHLLANLVMGYMPEEG